MNNEIENLKGKISRRNFLAKTGLSAGLIVLSPVINLSSKDFGPALSPFNSSSSDRNIINKSLIRPWHLKIEGNDLIVTSGEYQTEAKPLKVKKTKRFHIKPATIRQMVNEELYLSKDKPGGYWIGTHLTGPYYDGLGVYCSLIENTLKIKDQNGRVLKKEDDYLVSPSFSLVGLGNRTNLTPKDKVYASYSYFLQRIDSIALDDSGVPFLIEGTPALVCPPMPEIPAGAIRFCNVYRPILGTKLMDDHLFPVLSSGKHVETNTTKGRINKTLKKLIAGESVNIVALGDSITAGSNVKPGEGWPDVLHKRLVEKFPNAKINFTNHSIGGTRSMQWLYDGNFPDMDRLSADKCSFSLVEKDKPDLIIMEFVNDTVLKDQSVLKPAYEMLKDKINKLGAELIINTPSRNLTEDYNVLNESYDMLIKRGYNVEVENMKKIDSRPYISFIKSYAEEYNFALADVSTRWEHLYKEGIPYISILINAYNHPNPFGHLLFVEEQMKCFE